MATMQLCKEVEDPSISHSAGSAATHQPRLCAVPATGSNRDRDGINCSTGCAILTFKWIGARKNIAGYRAVFPGCSLNHQCWLVRLVFPRVCRMNRVLHDETLHGPIRRNRRPEKRHYRVLSAPMAVRLNWAVEFGPCPADGLRRRQNHPSTSNLVRLHTDTPHWGTDTGAADVPCSGMPQGGFAARYAQSVDLMFA